MKTLVMIVLIAVICIAISGVSAVSANTGCNREPDIEMEQGEVYADQSAGIGCCAKGFFGGWYWNPNASGATCEGGTSAVWCHNTQETFIWLNGNAYHVCITVDDEEKGCRVKANVFRQSRNVLKNCPIDNCQYGAWHPAWPELSDKLREAYGC